MNADDKAIVEDFQDESKKLITQLQEILDRCEGDASQIASLDEYGQTVDRIMGGAKTIVMALSAPSPLIVQIGDYAAVCKAVGYKASQIRGNEQFYDICVALLQDATEVLEELVDHLFEDEQKSARTFFNQAFIDRLKWVSGKFGAEFRSSVATKEEKSTKMAQSDIDELLRKLGLD